MKVYECLYIVKTDITDEKKDTIKRKLEDILKTNGGEVVRFDDWGKRKFTYEIEKSFKGYYYLITFRSEPDAVRIAERYLKIEEDVLRYQTVVLKQVQSAA